MQLVMIAAAQWIALYIIPLLLWLVLIHAELRNCPVLGTNTFGLLSLFSVVYPI